MMKSGTCEKHGFMTAWPQGEEDRSPNVGAPGGAEGRGLGERGEEEPEELAAIVVLEEECYSAESREEQGGQGENKEGRDSESRGGLARQLQLPCLALFQVKCRYYVQDRSVLGLARRLALGRPTACPTLFSDVSVVKN
eukprot:3065058-Rhodomonas_salina.2